MITGKTIQTGELRFARTLPSLALNGHATSSHYSVTGMSALLSRPTNSPLLQAMRRGVPGEELLPASDRELVRLIMAENAGSLHSIAPPTATPWTCPRCRRHYAASLKWATAHANADDCPMRRQKNALPSRVAAPAQAPKYHRNWLANTVHRLLRQEPHAWERRWTCAGCRNRIASGPCDDCLFSQWGNLAQNAAKWEDLIHGDCTGRGARRRGKPTVLPLEPWVDPHHLRLATARNAMERWLDATAGLVAARLMPEGVIAAVRGMGGLPPPDQLRVGAHALARASTQPTKTEATRYLLLLARDRARLRRISCNDRHHLWTLLDLKAADLPVLLTPTAVAAPGLHPRPLPR